MAEYVEWVLMKPGLSEKIKRRLEYAKCKINEVNKAPVVPIKSKHAHAVLVYHKWWRMYPSYKNALLEFEKFLDDHECPTFIKQSHERAIAEHSTAELESL